MAIAKLQPDATPPIQVTTPTTIEETPKSIFTSLIPENKLGTLLKYVEGYPWTINYYGQINNVNNTVEQFDPTTPNIAQPYYKVNGLILQVNSPLSSSYNEEKGITTVSGSALMPFKVIPNVGDIFIAQVDTGEDAIFHVVSVIRKTHRKESLYEINYNLHTYTSETPDFVSILEARVNETYFFNKDSGFFNRDLLIKPSVKEAKDRLSVFMEESKQFYFSTFVNVKTSSLLVPGHPQSLYDPVLTRFINKTVDTSNYVIAKHHSHAYVSEELDQPSILDCMVTRTIPHPNHMNTTYNFISSYSLPIRARLGTVSFNGVGYILYPTLPNFDSHVGYPKSVDNVYIDAIKTDKNYIRTNPIIIKTTNNNAMYEKPLLHELFENNYYIVTEHFYQYFTDKSVYDQLSYIELLLYKFFKQEPIALEDLAVAVEQYRDWSVLDKFYLLPVMWLLIRVNNG